MNNEATSHDGGWSHFGLRIEDFGSAIRLITEMWRRNCSDGRETVLSGSDFPGIMGRWMKH